VAEALAGRSYQGHFGTRLQFGLGAAEQVDKVEVRWLGKEFETFTQIGSNRLHKLKEGTGSKRQP
jgi:enediyne biosynthesis protein E4